MPTKLTYDFIKSEFEKRGYILLETKYINAHTKMKYICNNGHENSIRWYDLNNGTGCKNCSIENKKFTYDYIKQEFEKRNYKILDTIYTNSYTKMKCICDKGHECYIKWNDFQQGYGCKKCVINNQKLTYEFVKSEFEKIGYILLETKYINNSTKMKYICDKGHECSITYGNFKQGSRCKKCFIENKKLTFEIVKKNLKKEIIHYWKQNM